MSFRLTANSPCFHSKAGSGTCYGRILDYYGLCLLPICPFQKPLRYIRDRLSGKAQISQKGGAHAARSRYLVHPLSIPSLSRNNWHLPITYRPYRTSLALLTIIKETYGDEFTWRKPPYEYDFERFPIDLILGDASIRLALEEGKESKELIADYIQELEGFLEFRRPYLIYKE
jgi:hypothetical protein